MNYYSDKYMGSDGIGKWMMPMLTVEQEVHNGGTYKASDWMESGYDTDQGLIVVMGTHVSLWATLRGH